MINHDMKILVAIKRVIDYNVPIRIKTDGSGIETHNVKMAMNPFDAIALEEAIRIQEKNKLFKEILAVSIGSLEVQETLRQALAMGANRALHIESDKSLDTLHIAKILASVVEKEKPDLVLLGKQAIDDDCNQTGQMLAGLLNWPQGTFASKVNIQDEYKKILVTREVDGGLETVLLHLPAIITADLRLNEPRYATLPHIMQAKRKPLDKILLSELNLNLTPHHEILAISPPPARKQGIRLNTVEELIDKLIHDKVLS